MRLGRARDALSPKAQTAFDDLIERMSSESVSETRARSFRPQTIKLKQGTSNDENCPELADSGSLYTSDGIVLTAINEAKAKKLGEGQKVLFRAKRAGVAIISDFAADQEFTILKANEDGTLLLEANGKKFPAPRSYVYDATLPAEPKPRAPPGKKPEADGSGSPCRASTRGRRSR